MRIGKFRLVNYIGLYNGSNISDFFVDFNKQKHRLCIIKGPNGSGKSTIIEALHPLPDSNSCFVPKLEARKEIEIIDGDIIYDIKIIHPVSDSGTRMTTKAYIHKIQYDERLNLNPNGNVSSFKDILEEYLRLDSSFLELSFLSIKNRGIVDKPPAERKKHVNSNISGLEAYNNIYKTMTKRATVFKSMISNITSKINSIGSAEQLEPLLTSIENRLNKLYKDREVLINKRAEFESLVKIADPNGEIQDSYNSLYNRGLVIDNDIIALRSKIVNIFERNNLTILDYESCSSSYVDTKKLIEKRRNEIDSFFNRKSQVLNNISLLASEMSLKEAKLMSIEYNNTYDIELKIKSLENDIEFNKSIIKKIGFSDKVYLSKEEYMMSINILNDLRDSILTFKSNINSDILEKVLYNYSNNLKENIDDSEIFDIENRISEISLSIINIESKLHLLEYLELRPSECKIDSCHFISKSLEFYKTKPVETLDTLYKEKDFLENRLEVLKKESIKSQDILSYQTQLNMILNSVYSNWPLLSKLPNADRYTKGCILDRINSNDYFTDIQELTSYLDYCNVFELIREDEQLLSSLKNRYEINKQNKSYYDEVSNDIQSIKNKIEKENIELLELEKTINDNLKFIEFCDNKNKIIKEVLSMYEELNSLLLDRDNINNSILIISKNMESIKTNIREINAINERISLIDKEIKPALEDRDNIKHSIKLYYEYLDELEEFNAKYDKVLTIRDESSPTKGIQILFVKLYMGKILNICNELLSNFFGGKYFIPGYDINDGEFKIPCQGSGIMCDDVSSMSMSEVCMISMIMGFSIMLHSSSRYNILRLDEIDGGLDTENRSNFLYTLDLIANRMGTEQAILISHNSEANLDEFDVISLEQSYNNEGNTIYSINNKYEKAITL